MIKTVVTAFAFILLAVFTAPAQAADAKKCQLQRYGELPVHMSGTQPLIAGTINGAPARFLADSGAFFSMMTRESAEKHRLAVGPLPDGLYVVGTGGTAKVGRTKVQKFSLAGFGGGHVYDDVEFMVGNYEFGGDVDGIIGQNVLGNADTEYDLANGVIRVFKAKDCDGNVVAYWRGSSSVAEVKIEPTSPGKAHLIGEAKINGKKIKVIFDTGAWRSILDLDVAKKVGITPDDEDVVAGGISRGLGSRTTENYLARFDNFDIGGEVIKNARIRIGQVNLPGSGDMLLGADFFLSHRIYVSPRQKKIYFTYNGGPVFDLRPAANAPKTPPTNAVAAVPAASAEGAPPTSGPSTIESSSSKVDVASLRRRASASAGRGDFKSALADLNEVVRAEPDNAANFYERAGVHWRNREPVLAVADFDQALKLKPDHTGALLARATLNLGRKNVAEARADFDAAEKSKPGDSDIALQIAQTYSGMRHYPEAIARLGRWIEANPKDPRLPTALNERCWARAVIGTELQAAVEDCNAALRKGPRNSQVLDSRAFAYLRSGEFDKAIEDYKAVLKLQPKKALSMYGLGLAEIKKGLKAEGGQHVSAALALQPDVNEFYKDIGLNP